jgi:hypothetical protein
MCHSEAALCGTDGPCAAVQLLIRQNRENPTGNQQRGPGQPVSARRRRVGSICGMERACRSRGFARRERNGELLGKLDSFGEMRADRVIEARVGIDCDEPGEVLPDREQ